MHPHVSSICAHHQEVKIVLHSLWYHHTYRWPSCAQDERGLFQPVLETATYRCADTRGCVMQFWPPDDEHMCSKHVEAWNKLIVKQKFCASSWLITEINILRCTVSKTAKYSVQSPTKGTSWKPTQIRGETWYTHQDSSLPQMLPFLQK